MAPGARHRCTWRSGPRGCEPGCATRDRAACLSNMKQIGLGMTLYVQDYDETFPCSPWNGQAVGTTDNDSHNASYLTRFTWYWQLYPYTKNRAIWVCPSDPNPKHPLSGYS